MSILRSLLNSARLWWHRGASVKLDERVQLGHGVVTKPGAGKIIVGPDCTLETGAVLESYGGTIELQAGVFLGPYTVIYGHGGVTIGAGTLVAMHCRIVSSNHGVPAFGTPIRLQPDELRRTTIGRDVWLGAGVTILGGVTIGDGCVVGAGAVVTKALPPGAIALGVPAVVTGYRPGSPGPI